MLTEGMSTDHLFLILENERDSMFLVEMGSSLATGKSSMASGWDE